MKLEKGNQVYNVEPGSTLAAQLKEKGFEEPKKTTSSDKKPAEKKATTKSDAK